jgi:hypothetical protein
LRVVNAAVAFLEDELSDCHTGTGAYVRLAGVLNDPTGRAELPVDVLARLGFASEVVVVRVGHDR